VVKRLTNTNSKVLKDSVQALHKYYVENDVRYDDTSTRLKVMDEWGYEIIFAGEVPWTDLPLHVALKRNKDYIFDIEGHTVKVSVTRDIPEPPASLAKPAGYFLPESDPDNYKSGAEFTKRVRYIWAK